MAEKILEVQNLKKTFLSGKKSFTAVEDVSFFLNAGEVLGIVGESGSGKSTFLRCINQLESPSGGIVEYEGKNLLDKKCDIRKFREEVGMVFQRFNLFPLKTVAENVMMAPVLTKHMNKEEAHEKALELLDKVGLKDKADVYPSTLSGGQQQRVSIGRALMNAPAIILADEPTGNLDTQNTQEIMQLLKASNKTYKQTIILITHDRDIALQANRVLEISDGQLVRDEVIR